MDDFLIELDESNVQHIINDVKVIEEKFNEDSEIRLNEDQILIEITNLLNDNTKLRTSLIEHKAYRYRDLMMNVQDTMTFPAIKGQYTAVVDVIKQVLLTEEDEEIDEAYETEYDVKMIYQQAFLKQFVNQSNIPWKSAIPRIFALTVPWINKKGGVQYTFKKSLDLVKQDNKLVSRTIGEEPQLLYDGDLVNVTGIVIEGNPSMKKTLVFDIEEYFNTLKSFQPSQKVIVCFNDFFEEITDDRCTHQATIVRILAKKGVFLTIPFPSISNTEIFVPYDAYSPIWVFDAKSSTYYNKRDILQVKNCTLKFLKKMDFFANCSFGVPVSASECIHMHINIIKNLSNLRWIEQQVLQPYGYALDDLDYVTLARIKKTINLVDNDTHHQQHLRKHLDNNQLIPSIDVVEILEQWRNYIQKKEGIFSSLQLSKVRDQVEQQMNKLESSLRKIKNDDTCRTDKHGSITMRLNSYSELNALDVDKLFFQKDYDPTKYSIKYDILKDQPRINDEALKSKIYDHLRDSYPKKSEAELQFELKSILKGKRKVRKGDLAVVSVPRINLDLVFQLSEIDGKLMWIKIMKTPYLMCDNRDDIIKMDDRHCVLDTYEGLCKSIEYAKVNHQLKILRQQYDLLKDINSSLNVVDRLIEDFKLSAKIVYPRGSPIVKNISDIDDQEYFGDEDYVDVDALFGNVENFDGEFAVLYQNIEKENKKDDAYEYEKELASLDFLCQLLGVELETAERKEIAMYAGMECKEHYKPVDKEEFYKSKFKVVNQEFYKTKPGYKQKIDQAIDKKYQDAVSKNNREYHYHTIIYMTAFLSAVIMARYPRLVMKSVVSSCSNFISYVGFPIKSKGQSSSIHQYLACVLIKTSMPDDERLSMFYENTQEQIRNELESTLEKICLSHGKLAEAIHKNKDNVLYTSKKLSVTKSTHENVFEGFRPDISLINNVKGQKIAVGMDEFEDIDMKNLNNKRDFSTKQCNNVYIPLSYLFSKDRFQQKKLLQENVTYVDVKKDSLAVNKFDSTLSLLGLSDILDHMDDDDWWDKIMYENISKKLDSMSLSPELKAYLIVHQQTLASVNTICQFLHSSLPCLLSKLLHKRVLKTDTVGTKNIIFDVHEGKGRLNYIQKALEDLLVIRKQCWVFQGDEQEDIIKNHMVLSYILLYICEVLHDPYLIKIVDDHFVKHMSNNILQEHIIRESMEALREKRKTELMEKYKANDEDRQLQMTLKTLGMDTWYDVGNDNEAEAEPEQNKQPILITEDVQEFYADQGENADDDDEEA